MIDDIYERFEAVILKGLLFARPAAEQLDDFQSEAIHYPDENSIFLMCFPMDRSHL